MAETDAVQHVFAPLDEAITTLSDDLKVSYLEALPEELANLNANEVHVENGGTGTRDGG